MKKCSKCKEVKELSGFTKDKSKKDGLDIECKECKSEASRKYYSENRNKRLEDAKKYRLENSNRAKEYARRYRFENRDKVWNNQLKMKYGINLNRYNEMLHNQGNCCAICNIHQDELTKRLCVDHNHEYDSKEEYGVRGLLCSPCNTTKVGSNNVSSIKNVLGYLRKYEDV